MTEILRLPDRSSACETDARNSHDAPLHGLVTLRAAAAIAVVALHAGVPYLRNPMPGLAWTVRDASSGIVDTAFWLIELFIMPLFLFIAGFLAMKSYRRAGVVNWARSRMRRLLRPLAFGCLVILPMDLYIWVTGWVCDGVVPMHKLRSLKFDATLEAQLWGLSHLWFLLYVATYVAAIAAVVVIAGWTKWRPRAIVEIPGLVIALTLFMTATAAVFVAPEVVWGFQHQILPVPSKWIYCGVFFAFGFAYETTDRQLRRLATIPRRYRYALVPLVSAAMFAGIWNLKSTADPSTVGTESMVARLTLAITTVSAAAGLTIGLIGWASRCVGPPHRWVEYVAAASFWIYLVHHPIVGLVHIDLKWIAPGLAPTAKWLISTALASGFCLFTYEILIRRSALGRWLGMAWRPSPEQATIPLSTATVSPRRRAA